MHQENTYVIVKNHVRELTNTDAGSVSEHESKKKSKKKASLRCSSETDNNANQNEIAMNNTLEELRSAYKRCKGLVKKIERRYGTLLNLKDEEESNPDTTQKRKIIGDDSEAQDQNCQCPLNKKIKFDEDGKQTVADTPVRSHICVKNSKSAKIDTEMEQNKLKVEFYNAEEALPDDIKEISDILRNPDIDKKYRNNLNQKMKALRQECMNELKFNKKAIIEKLKTNPDEVFVFPGSNLSSLPGYIY